MIGYYLVGFVNAILNLVTVFGFSLSGNQIGAIDLVVNAALLVLGAVFHWKIQPTNTPEPPIVNAPSRSTVE